MASTNDQTTGVVKGLMRYLDEKHQKSLLPEIQRALNSLVSGSRHATVMEITCAVKPAERQVELIRSYMNTLVKQKLSSQVRVDPRILGGFTVRIGDWILDASIRKDLSDIQTLLIS